MQTVINVVLNDVQDVSPSARFAGWKVLMQQKVPRVTRPSTTTTVPEATRLRPSPGIQLSPDMLSVLQRRAADLEVTVGALEGDMTTTHTGKRHPLVFLIFNTIFNLLTQDDQIRGFENAAHHLDPDGVFLIETAVPSAWTSAYSYVNAESITPSSIELDVCKYDPGTQIFDENHVRLDAAGAHFRPISCRLAWPADLDPMARLAGLRLRERWGGWKREPFSAASKRHVLRPVAATERCCASK